MSFAPAKPHRWVFRSIVKPTHPADVKAAPGADRAPVLSCWRSLETRLNHLFLLILVASALAGCASLMPQTGDQPVQRAWSGRFALTVTPPAQPEQRTSGNFRLMQTTTATLLELSTPLGVTIASARIDAQGASVVTADGKRFAADSGEALTEQLFGWRIPVQRLPDWLAGKPAKILEFSQDKVLGDSERLPLLAEEDGWTLRYEAWNQRQLARLVLTFPERVSMRMVLTHEAAP